MATASERSAARYCSSWAKRLRIRRSSVISSSVPMALATSPLPPLTGVTDSRKYVSSEKEVPPANSSGPGSFPSAILFKIIFHFSRSTAATSPTAAPFVDIWFKTVGNSTSFTTGGEIKLRLSSFGTYSNVVPVE